jgi:membrane-associated protease RseP (regulator of RpoE activity)
MRLEAMRGLAGKLCGLAVVGVLLTALVVRADDKDSKKADRPKKDRPAPGVVFPDFEELLKGFPGGPDDDLMKELRQQMEEVQQRLRQMQRGMMPGRFPVFPNQPFGPRAAPAPSAQESRLGAQLKAPNATLADQLDLPRDQGMVLEELAPNSPASKAGMRPHDILLELNGKPVSSKRAEFDKLLEGIAAGKKVDAVVMRKGKKETIKDLSLPEAKPVVWQEANEFPRMPALGGFGRGLVIPNLAGLGGSTTITRTNDSFTARHRGNGVTITVKGSLAQDKANVSEVAIESGGETKTYDSLDKVPQEHQALAKKLADMAGGRAAFRRR